MSITTGSPFILSPGRSSSLKTSLNSLNSSSLSCWHCCSTLRYSSSCSTSSACLASRSPMSTADSSGSSVSGNSSVLNVLNELLEVCEAGYGYCGERIPHASISCQLSKMLCSDAPLITIPWSIFRLPVTTHLRNALHWPTM